jgi:hypothetical protein
MCVCVCVRRRTASCSLRSGCTSRACPSTCASVIPPDRYTQRTSSPRRTQPHTQKQPSADTLIAPARTHARTHKHTSKRRRTAAVQTRDRLCRWLTKTGLVPLGRMTKSSLGIAHIQRHTHARRHARTRARSHTHTRHRHARACSRRHTDKHARARREDDPLRRDVPLRRADARDRGDDGRQVGAHLAGARRSGRGGRRGVSARGLSGRRLSGRGLSGGKRCLRPVGSAPP